MKTVKRILAVLLTVCMVMGLAVPAVAAETGKLTITQAIPNATYSVYKMLDIVDWTWGGTSNTEVTSSVYYLSTENTAWKNFFVDSTKAEGNLAPANIAGYVEVSMIDGDDNYYVEWTATTTNGSGETVIDDAAAEDFAKLALEYAKNPANSVSSTATDTAEVPADPTVTTSSVTFTNLPFGYYLVDTNGGAVVALDTFAADKEIEEKNTAPVIEKKVKDEKDGSTGDNQWQDDNTASIGDTVSFKTTITVGTGATNYILHDSMTGLDFVSVSSVKLYETDGAATPTYTEKATLTAGADKDYTVTNPGTDSGTVATGETCDFEVKFNNTIFGENAITVAGTTDKYTIKEGDQLVVEYTATLSADAVVADAGNPNKTLLAYGVTADATSEPPLKTPQDETITYTYEFDLVKTNKKNEVIEGAKFELYGSNAADATAIELVDVTIAGGEKSYRVATATDTNKVTEIEAGNVTIIGLGKGTYYLKETTAPTGYKKLTSAVPVEIVNANLDAAVTSATDGEGNNVDTWTEGGVHVVNVKKSIFPHTGGIGVTVYYLAGGAIIALVAAAAVMVFKKRQNGKA